LRYAPSVLSAIIGVNLRLSGDRQPDSAEMIAKKIEPSLDAADEGLVRVLFEASPQGGRPG